MLEDVFEKVQGHNARILGGMGPSPHDGVITEAGQRDAEQGFARCPMRLEELEKFMGRAPYRLIRRFVIRQGGDPAREGAQVKFRVIDDAADGGQSDLSHDENQLRFCSAIQPAHHLAQVVRALACLGAPWPERETVVSAGGVPA